MANLSNGKSVNNSHLKKRNMLNANSMGPDESNEVLDLRKSNPDKLCFWCGKRGSLSESGVESDFCSEICFDQFRRDSFKKRSTCMWCNNSNHGGGVININLISSLDESKFCSDYCLTQFKVRLFCEETSAHLDKLKEGSVTVMNGVSTSTAATTKSASKSPMSIVSAESTLSSNDLITPDLWLKKSQTKKSSTCTLTSPFPGHSPKRNSESPPLISPSPSSDVETVSMNESFLHAKGSSGSGLGLTALNRLQSINVLPLANSVGKSPFTTFGAANLSVGKTKGLTTAQDSQVGESQRKRSKLTPQHSPNEFSGWNIASQASKGAQASPLRGFKGSRIRIMENKAVIGKESPVSHGGGVRGARPPMNVNNCMPFQNSFGRAGGKASPLIPYPQNLFMANGHANKLNFGTLGLALSGGFGLGAFPSNFLPQDDNSTESSSSCSTTTSQVMESIKKKESLQRKNQRTNPVQLTKESQTDFDSQSHEAGPETNNLASSVSVLSPVTVLVPFPVAVPIPIPIPIPVILGSGFNMTERSFNSMKATNEARANSMTTGETSTSQVRIECNSTTTKRVVSNEKDTDDSQTNSSSTPVPGESKEGKSQAVCGLVKVEDSLSAAR